jgi:tetratricopeptide (TPR) repeat protein
MKHIALLTGMLLALLMTGRMTAQDQSQYGETEEQQIACMEALSVYTSFKSQKNMKDAYRTWQKACEVCPIDVKESLYIDGARFIKEELKVEKERARKLVLADSLMLIYDIRMAQFPTTDRNPDNRCYVLGFKAGDFSRLFSKRTDAIYAMYKEAYECAGQEASASVLSGYYIALFEMFKTAEGKEKSAYLSDLLTDYLALQDYVDSNIKATDDERTKDGYEKARNNLDEIFVQIADCDQMVPVLEQKVADSPDDQELKKKVLRLMNRKDCSDGDFFIAVAQAVYETDPDHPSAYAIGKTLLKSGDYSGALTYFEEAINNCNDCSELETYLLRAGQVSSVLKQLTKARNYAKRVLAINPKNGQAILLEGDVIFSMSSQCDDGALGARSVYWLAADYYARAKSVDPSVSETASKKIAAAKGQYPSKEDIFQFSKKEGESFTVPCLGETTTIRIR